MLCVGVGRREVEPFVCFDVVLRYVPAVGVHHAKVVLRVRMPLLRRFAKPRHRFDVVLRDALSTNFRTNVF